MALTSMQRPRNPKKTPRNPKINIPPPRFRRGELVEVASAAEGFVGSYYEATVLADRVNDLNIKNGYVVQYRTLVKDDWTGPLRELVSTAEVRPRPPVVRVAEFGLNDVVDAFDNDGWWVGKITGMVEDQYCVWFETTGDLIAYAKERLRIHQDWLNGNWI